MQPSHGGILQLTSFDLAISQSYITEDSHVLQVLRPLHFTLVQQKPLTFHLHLDSCFILHHSLNNSFFHPKQVVRGSHQLIGMLFVNKTRSGPKANLARRLKLCNVLLYCNNKAICDTAKTWLAWAYFEYRLTYTDGCGDSHLMERSLSMSYPQTCAHVQKRLMLGHLRYSSSQSHLI